MPVRDGETGPVALAWGTRRVQPRRERKRTGDDEWRVGTRRPRAAARTLAPRASREVTEPDTRYRSRSSLTPTWVSEAALAAPWLADLARGITAGACIAASCKRGKRAVGMDASQGRPGQGWQPHRALSLLVVWFFSDETPRSHQLTPALPLPHVRDGLRVLRLEAV